MTIFATYISIYTRLSLKYCLMCFFDRRVPSLLEYFGYLFHHSTMLVGPVCTFSDYMDFIEGRDIARATDKVSGMIFCKSHVDIACVVELYQILHC